MAKLGELLGWSENPLYQFWDSNRNTFGQMGASLAKDGWESTGEGALRGSQLDAQIAEKKKEEAKRIAAINATAEAMKAHPDLAALVQANPDMMGPAVSEMWRRQSAQAQGGGDNLIEINGQLVDKTTGKVVGDYRTPESARGGAGEVSLQPTWMQDAQGKWFLGQLTKDGRVIRTETPDGMTPVSPYELSADRTGGQVDAKTAAAARAALPGAEQTAQITVSAIDRILNNEAGLAEQFGQTMGVPNQMIPFSWPGSPKANIQNDIAMAQGGAFLQARQWLKGQGAITEMESAKAEGAMSQMEMASKSGDKEAFTRAAQEFRQAVLLGVEKVRQAAQGEYAAGNVPSLGGGTSMKQKYGLP